MKTRITRHSLLCGALLMLGLLTSACSDDPKADPTPAPACEAGSLDCECYANDTCDEGLACVDSICATDDDPNLDPNPGPNPDADPNPDLEPGVPTGLGLPPDLGVQNLRSATARQGGRPDLG